MCIHHCGGAARTCSDVEMNYSASVSLWMFVNSYDFRPQFMPAFLLPVASGSAVSLEELDDLGAQQTDEGRGKHGFRGVGVLEVTVRLLDHFEQRRQQPTILCTHAVQSLLS